MPCDRCRKSKTKMEDPVKGAYGYRVLCRECYRELGSGVSAADRL